MKEIKEISIKQLKKKLTKAIKDCERDAVNLEFISHKRIDLEGKIYAYEYVKYNMIRDIIESENNLK